MSSYRIGSGYFGSPNIQTSTANQEIIQQHKPSDWSISRLSAYKFSFHNDGDCHIKINGSDNPIYVRASQGFESTEVDSPIWSFVIVDAGITYNYIGAY